MEEHYYHICQECGEPAFEYKKKPEAGQPMFVDDIVGEHLQPGDPITCQNCHRPVPPKDLTIGNVVFRPFKE